MTNPGCWLALLVLGAGIVCGQEERSTYVLGPDDTIVIRVLDVDEIGKEPVRIDMRGNINLPMLGRVKVSGLTPEQVEDLLMQRLKAFVKEPQVSVGVTEMRSQPVSVFGAVASPGVHQVQGRKTLFEVLSMVGGLRQDAGYSIKITRRKEWGKLPLPDAQQDPSGHFWVGEVKVADVMNARNPAENILIMPQDTISVPKGEVVYVMGAVKKSGGFVLGEKERVTAMEALTLAEGFGPFAKGGQTKILRKSSDPEKRQEITVNLDQVLIGKVKDVLLESDDILYVPTSTKKRAMARAGEAAIGLGTGLILYRR